MVSATTKGPSIVLKNIHKSYTVEAQRVDALRGVDLKVGPGCAAAVTGKSGAGKSTLLHIVGTLDRPTTGNVFLNETDVSKMSDPEASNFRNCSVGFVFQLNNLLPEFSALENVMMPGLIAKANKNAVRDRASKLLNQVGLGKRVGHRPSELSGGEQQRVAIARALLMAPPFLLADEPTGNLDRKTSQAIQELLIQLVTENKMTLLLVTHDLELAKKLPHQIVMEDGRILEGNEIYA